MIPVAILAGGFARRMDAMGSGLPKALFDINGVPFAVRQLELLKQRGYTNLVYCVGYRSEMIKDVLGDGSAFDVSIRYSDDGVIPLGTGGAIRKALPLLGPAFLMLHGDVYLDTSYAAIAQELLQRGTPSLMTVTAISDEMKNADMAHGMITRYDKASGVRELPYLDAGVSAFEAEAFEPWPNGATFDLDAVYQRYIQTRQLAGFDVNAHPYEIGSPDGLQELRAFLK